MDRKSFLSRSRFNMMAWLVVILDMPSQIMYTAEQLTFQSCVSGVCTYSTFRSTNRSIITSSDNDHFQQCQYWRYFGQKCISRSPTRAASLPDSQPIRLSQRFQDPAPPIHSTTQGSVQHNYSQHQYGLGRSYHRNESSYLVGYGFVPVLQE